MFFVMIESRDWKYTWQNENKKPLVETVPCWFLVFLHNILFRALCFVKVLQILRYHIKILIATLFLLWNIWKALCSPNLVKIFYCSYSVHFKDHGAIIKFLAHSLPFSSTGEEIKSTSCSRLFNFTSFYRYSCVF